VSAIALTPGHDILFPAQEEKHIMATPTNIIEQGTAFLQALVEWQQQLPGISWRDLHEDIEAERVALFCVDMIKGFCTEGPLSSPRVQGIAPAVVTTFENAYTAGVRDFLLAQDAHTPDAVEFESYPPHCIEGTSEAETISELAQLPFADIFTIVPKNSLNPFHGTELLAWQDIHRDLSVAIVVGDCTDLCVHEMAMHLKLYANAHNRKMRVIVPANAVQTFDTPIETAKQLGILPHSADVMHLLFLYHMCLNGIEVVREIVV